MSTLVKELINTHGIDIDPHLDREALVPVSTGLQRQGDIIVIPRALADQDAVMDLVTGPRVGPVGVAVVRGEAGGNTHQLLADGDVSYGSLDSVLSGATNAIGVLTVEEGATAYLAHPEHGYAGIGPGKYIIRRQREQVAAVVRVVAD